MSYSVGNKRKRGGSAQQKAYWANRRFSSLYPWSQAGAARIERGTAFSRNLFGDSMVTATPQQRVERLASGFTGRGKYGLRRTVGRFAKKHNIGKKAYNAAIGGALAGMTMGPEAILPAAAAGYGRGMYSGRGIYSGRGLYNKNVLMAGGQPSMNFSQGRNDNQEVTVTHCEYLQDVYGPPGPEFENNQLNINPGLSENFPWLSQLAVNYEEYELIQLVYEFRSTVDASATNNTSGATGTIIMATNYNPDAPKFTSKEGMMQYHGAVSGRLTDPLVHGVECDPSKNAGSATKYTRVTRPATSANLKDFDLGKFQWALVNIPEGFSNQQVGELWVSYTIRLQKPRLFSTLFRDLSRDRWAWLNGTSAYEWAVGPNRNIGQGGNIPIGQQFIQTTAQNSPAFQNITGVTMEVINGYAPVIDQINYAGYSAPTTEYRLNIPSYMTASFKVTFKFTCNATAAGNNGFLRTLTTFLKDGNVKSVMTMPMLMDQQTSPQVISALGITTNTRITAEAYVTINPAVAGVSSFVSCYLQDLIGTAQSFYSSVTFVSAILSPYNETLDNSFVADNLQQDVLVSNTSVQGGGFIQDVNDVYGPGVDYQVIPTVPAGTTLI